MRQNKSIKTNIFSKNTYIGRVSFVTEDRVGFVEFFLSVTKLTCLFT